MNGMSSVSGVNHYHTLWNLWRCNMSQYLNLYLKVKDDLFIPIYSVTRNSVLYNNMQNYVPYGKTTPLTINLLDALIEGIDKDKLDFITQKNYMEAGKYDIYKCEAGLSEKMDMIREQDRDIKLLDELIEEYDDTIRVIRFLKEIINNAYYSECIDNLDDCIYAGIEA